MSNSTSQTIYIQAKSGTTISQLPPVSDWITANDESIAYDRQSQSTVPHWTTKRPIWKEFYPVLFTASQRKTTTRTGRIIVYTSKVVESPSIIYHSVIFEKRLSRGPAERTSDTKYSTYDTWHLIPLNRPVIQPPDSEPIISYFQTPQRDYVYSPGAWMPGVLSDEMPVKRSGSFEFKIEDSFLDSSEYDYASLRNDIDSALHGKILSITLGDDPQYNYFGVVRTEWEEEQSPKLMIHVECEPYKYGRYMMHQHYDVASSYLDFDSSYSAPARVGVLAEADIETLVISGLARNPITQEAETITLYNMTTGQQIVIDGEEKTILDVNTQENAFSQSEFWAFPSVVPGRTLITTNSQNVKLNVITRPRFV